MIKGIYPGSLKAPDNIHSKLLRKRDALLALYTSHFNQRLSVEAVLDRATWDLNLAREIYVNHGGQWTVGTAKIITSNYFRNSIQDFVRDAKKKGLIVDAIGQGLHGLTLLMKEDGYEVVIKLPVNPTANLDGDGYCALQNEFDHTQRISQIPEIDYSLVSRPIDQMSIRGKVLAFAKLAGQDLFARDDFTDNRRAAFVEYSQREGFAPERIADLLQIYMQVYRADIPTLSYGSPHNTRLLEDGKALALFDLCSQPPLPEHDLGQIYLQKKLFADKALACALFQVLGNGNINFLVAGEVPERFRTNIESTSDRGKRFYEYRERLLRDTLQVLLDRNIVTKAELVTNLQSLRDVNDRMNADDVKYLQFKDHAQLIGAGQDSIQRLIEHFAK